MLGDIIDIKILWMNNKLYFSYAIPTKNLLIVFLFKCMLFLKCNSSINFSFYWSLRNELSSYIKGFNCSWSTKSSQSMAALFTFNFISSKRISSLFFFGSRGASSCFDDNSHPFSYSFIISTQNFLLQLRIPKYFS